jgi:signal transduction histidine kinase
MGQKHQFHIFSQKELNYFYYALSAFGIVANLMDNFTLGTKWNFIFSIYNWVTISLILIGIALFRFKKLALKPAFSISVFSIFLNLILSNITDMYLGESYVLCLLRQTIFVCFITAVTFLFISRVHGTVLGCIFAIYYTISTIVSHDEFLIANLGNILGIFIAFILVLSYFQTYLKQAVYKIKSDAAIIVEQNEELMAINQELTAVNQELTESQKQINAQHEELLTLSESISFQNQMLEDKNTKLEVAITEKAKLFSIIAHDLKSPISSTTSLTELMLDKFEEMPEEKKKIWLSKILSSNNLLYELLENLLMWSRSQTGALELEPVEIHLKESIEKIISIYKNFAAQKSVVLVMDVVDDLFINADKMMIETVLRNLISNALKYSFENGIVTVGARQEGKYVKIFVQDNGIGIKDDQVKTILNGSDIKSTLGTSGEKGTGLGLRISREFIEKHNGTICVENMNGTRVSFTIPLSVKKLA